MSAIDDPTRLQHMREAAIDALSFIDGYSRDDLENDRRSVFALVKAIEIIGEAASKVSKDCQSRYPQMPWAKMIGMRNRLVHAYDDVDLDVLWDTVTLALEPLIAELDVIIALEVK
jgi:uncharacterized protein with HEPN domain